MCIYYLSIRKDYPIILIRYSLRGYKLYIYIVYFLNIYKANS